MQFPSRSGIGSAALGLGRVTFTEQYFYESFPDRDEFVRAVYDDVCTRAISALNSSTTPRDAVERFVALMVDDPARGRVLLLAPEVEPVLTQSGAEWMPSFIDLLQRKLTRITDPAVQAMVATELNRRADGTVHRVIERAAWPRPASSSSTIASTCCSAGCRATSRYSSGVLTAARSACFAAAASSAAALAALPAGLATEGPGLVPVAYSPSQFRASITWSSDLPNLPS